MKRVLSVVKTRLKCVLLGSAPSAPLRFKKAIKSVGRLLGVEITRIKAESAANARNQPQNTNFAYFDPAGVPVELDAEDRKVLEFVLENRLSICGYNNLVTTLLACKHVVEQWIEGAVVECGVFRGGHAILAASVFGKAKTPRKIYLFDTFAGMAEPSHEDRKSDDGRSAHAIYLTRKKETYT